MIITLSMECWHEFKLDRIVLSEYCLPKQKLAWNVVMTLSASKYLNYHTCAGKGGHYLFFHIDGTRESYS